MQGGDAALPGSKPALLGPGVYLTVESVSLQLRDIRLEASRTVRATGMGIVRLASLGTGIISALTPDWLANKLWQPMLRSVEEAIVAENQCNPLFVMREVALASDLADYVTRATRRQVIYISVYM